jgi:hypothetical protein
MFEEASLVEIECDKVTGYFIGQATMKHKYHAQDSEDSKVIVKFEGETWPDLLTNWSRKLVDYHQKNQNWISNL